jgi:hypothetical protein
MILYLPKSNPNVKRHLLSIYGLQEIFLVKGTIGIWCIGGSSSTSIWNEDFILFLWKHIWNESWLSHYGNIVQPQILYGCFFKDVEWNLY